MVRGFLIFGLAPSKMGLATTEMGLAPTEMGLAPTTSLRPTWALGPHGALGPMGQRCAAGVREAQFTLVPVVGGMAKPLCIKSLGLLEASLRCRMLRDALYASLSQRGTEICATLANHTVRCAHVRHTCACAIESALRAQGSAAIAASRGPRAP